MTARETYQAWCARTDLTDALCSCVGIDLSRQVMTKSQMNNVMSVVKKPRS